MRITVSLPDELLQGARRRAKGSRVTLNELIEEALRAHLARPEGEAAAFRLQTVRGRLVNPELDLDRTSALAAADDETAYPRRLG
jgi:hypothetical protein